MAHKCLPRHVHGETVPKIPSQVQRAATDRYNAPTLDKLEYMFYNIVGTCCGLCDNPDARFFNQPRWKGFTLMPLIQPSMIFLAHLTHSRSSHRRHRSPFPLSNSGGGARGGGKRQKTATISAKNGNSGNPGNRSPTHPKAAPQAASTVSRPGAALEKTATAAKTAMIPATLLATFRPRYLPRGPFPPREEGWRLVRQPSGNVLA